MLLLANAKNHIIIVKIWEGRLFLMAKYSEAQNKATQKYIHNSYDQISIRIRKDGEITRENIQAAADQAGLSLNSYVLEAISEKMKKY